MAVLNELERYLATATELTSIRQRDGFGSDVQMRALRATTPPPLDLIVSARALLRRGPAVLVFDDAGVLHALPGGRREHGESLEETLARELREETGCGSVHVVRLLGAVHYHHLSPRPSDYPYPHPDNFHVIYLADTSDEPGVPVDPFVQRPRFVSVADARSAPLIERVFLDELLT